MWRVINCHLNMISTGLTHLTKQQLGRAWRTWVHQVLEMGIYLDVASMQFSHVVVTPQSDGAPRDIEYLWRGAAQT